MGKCGQHRHWTQSGNKLYVIPERNIVLGSIFIDAEIGRFIRPYSALSQTSPAAYYLPG